MRTLRGTIPGVVAVCAAAGPCFGDIVITEIMSNPASNEKQPVRTEWVEIYNTGDQAVDLSGWVLGDEDGDAAPLPEGATVEPKQAVVLIPGDCSVDDFRAAWGDDVRAYALANWARRPGMSGLANSPNADNERLTLKRNDGSIADEVNFADRSPWPSDEPDGAAIYLLPALINTTMNDDGANWRRASDGVHGARAAVATEVFSSEDVGSPGNVTESE